MKQLKHFFNRLLCLCGRHRYDIKNLEVTHDASTESYVFRDCCTRCGYKNVFTIPDENLLRKYIARNSE